MVTRICGGGRLGRETRGGWEIEEVANSGKDREGIVAGLDEWRGDKRDRYNE